MGNQGLSIILRCLALVLVLGKANAGIPANVRAKGASFLICMNDGA